MSFLPLDIGVTTKMAFGFHFCGGIGCLAEGRLADSKGHVAGTVHVKTCGDNNIFFFFSFSFSGAMFFVKSNLNR